MNSSPVDAFKLYEWLSSAGFPALLALILYTSYKGVWVWGSAYRAMEREKNEWKSFALGSTQLAKQAVSLTAQTISPTNEGSR